MERERREEERSASTSQCPSLGDTNPYTKEYAARVRYETRPAVREKTRDFYQAKRNAMYRVEEDQKEENRVKRFVHKRHFLVEAQDRVAEIKNTDLVRARSARDVLEDRRWRVG